ncbi:MAG: beta-ketoacyl reductase [bacterium]
MPPHPRPQRRPRPAPRRPPPLRRRRRPRRRHRRPHAPRPRRRPRQQAPRRRAHAPSTGSPSPPRRPRPPRSAAGSSSPNPRSPPRAEGLRARDAAVVTAPLIPRRPRSPRRAPRRHRRPRLARRRLRPRRQPPTRRRRRRPHHLVALLRAISRQDATGAPPRLWILTRGLPLADAPPTPDLGLGAAAAWGIARVAALELGPLWGGVASARARPRSRRRRAPRRARRPRPVQAMHRPGARLVPRLRSTPHPRRARHHPPRRRPHRRRPRRRRPRHRPRPRRPRRPPPPPRRRTPLPRATWRTAPQTTPPPTASPPILDLEARGAAIHPLTLDVADPAALTAALADYDALGYPPIRAVIHSAGVLRDAMLMRIADGDLDAVLRPKLAGALHLAACFQDRPLDRFVLFSSLTAVVGRVGQTAYAAANAALDALAHALRARGVPATSIAWGPWGETGMFSRLDTRQTRSIARPMSTARAVEAFARALAADLTHPVVADFHDLPDAPLFAELPRPSAPAAPQEPAPTGGEPLLELFLLPEADRPAAITARVTDMVAAVFRADPATLDARQPLAHLGLDSLMAIEITDGVRARYAVELPIQDTFTLSVRALAERIADRVVLDEAALEALLAEIEALPDAPLDATAPTAGADRAPEPTGDPR